MQLPPRRARAEALRKEIVNFLARYIKDYGFSPTVPEIAQHFHRSNTTIRQHLDVLADEDVLRWQYKQPRSLKLTGKPPR